MYIEVDSYVSCSLKNWAVQQRPPAGARERLLRLIDADIVQQHEAAINCFSYSRQEPASMHLAEQWAFGPFTQTRLWYFRTLSPAHLLS